MKYLLSCPRESAKHDIMKRFFPFTFKTKIKLKLKMKKNNNINNITLIILITFCIAILAMPETGVAGDGASCRVVS